MAYLLAQTGLAADIQLFEQNPDDAIFGFGVVFSDQALEFLRADDLQTLECLYPSLEHWRDICVIHRGQKVIIDGIGFSAIGRLDLLKILRQRLNSVGIQPKFEHRIKSLRELDDFDLVIGADGVNSIVRTSLTDKFNAEVSDMRNLFIWLGVEKTFNTLTQTFIQTEYGGITAHHYRYNQNSSTFIIEMGDQTWRNTGLSMTDSNQAIQFGEQVFRDTLEGAKLISNHSTWRRFPKVWNQKWFSGKYVLIGDALRTVHFSIGSGTRMAMEDSIALVKALCAYPKDLPRALAEFQITREPPVRKLVEAAQASADWYENMDARMCLPPMEFAHSYISRSGRLDMQKLARVSPDFARLLFDWRGNRH